MMTRPYFLMQVKDFWNKSKVFVQFGGCTKRICFAWQPQSFSCDSKFSSPLGDIFWKDVTRRMEMGSGQFVWEPTAHKEIDTASAPELARAYSFHFLFFLIIRSPAILTSIDTKVTKIFTIIHDLFTVICVYDLNVNVRKWDVNTSKFSFVSSISMLIKHHMLIMIQHRNARKARKCVWSGISRR